MFNNIITPETSNEIKKIMRATIYRGTCRKEFRGYKRDKILSKLNIGGKTGSIGSRKIRNVRYDWFVGFAEEKKGTQKIALSIIVAHEKFIGKKASYYAKIAIKKYFKDHIHKSVASR